MPSELPMPAVGMVGSRSSSSVVNLAGRGGDNSKHS